MNMNAPAAVRIVSANSTVNADLNEPTLVQSSNDDQVGKYAVIFNPENVLLKHEVWYKGPAESVDVDGYRTIKTICRVVKSCLSEKAANGYITYQQMVKHFKEAF